MRADEFASLFPGALGNFEHALFIGGVTGPLTAHVANMITGRLTVCDFDNARLSELKQLQGLSKPINTRHVLPVPAGSPDIMTAYSCSEATHSSLARPATIADKMPGLSFTETVISTSSVYELVSEMGLNDALSNLLVISVTGFEELWLDQEVELLRYFDTVLVRLPLAGWFDTAEKSDQLLSQRALPGVALPFGNLPYRWWMIKQPMGWGAKTREFSDTRQQLSDTSKLLQDVRVTSMDLSEEISSLKSLNDDQAAVINSLQESLASKDHDLEQATARASELETRLRDHTEMTDALKESLASQDHDLERAMERLAVLEVDLSSAVEQAEAHEAGVTSLQSDLANSQDARTSLESDLSESHQTIDELKAKLEQQTQWHLDNKKWAESLTGKLQNSEQEKREQTEIASLAQKMLAKSQGDLEALRDKYEQKVISERDMMNLISELRKKLTAASQYYIRLQQAHPEILAPPRSGNEY